MKTDEELHAGWADGDRRSAERLVDRYLPAMKRFFANKVAEAQDVEDCVGTTFERVAMGLKQFRGESSFRTYLYGTGRNVLREYIRARMRRKGEIDLDSADDKERDDAKREQDAEEFKLLLDALRAGVQDHVKEVRVSNRLTSSPACLVVDEGDLSPQIGELLRRSGQKVPDVKPILEINPTHPLLAKLKSICDADANDPRLADYATLLFGQAMLAEGGQLEDPATFSRRIAELMLETL